MHRSISWNIELIISTVSSFSSTIIASNVPLSSNVTNNPSLGEISNRRNQKGVKVSLPITVLNLSSLYVIFVTSPTSKIISILFCSAFFFILEMTFSDISIFVINLQFCFEYSSSESSELPQPVYVLQNQRNFECGRVTEPDNALILKHQSYH